MNYRHAFHAGNFADVVKHAVFARCVVGMTEKPTPFRVVDTHAGVGVYDLASDEARRSPEWRDGVLRLWEEAGRAPPEALPGLAPLMGVLRALNPSGELARYPGSPLIARMLMRSIDRLQMCELHPQDAETLRETLKSPFDGGPRWSVEERDGYGALAAYLPPPERRGLVIVDPPFENRDEFKAMIEAAHRALRRWPEGRYLFWRPLKALADVEAFDRDLAGWLAGSGGVAAEKIIAVDHWVRAPGPGKLAGAGLLVINAPFGLEADLRGLLPWLTDLLRQSDDAGWRVEHPR
ncbi:23S rRNA (adenine(2030)-N(6))-methyltransferase RlmJ [bacterium]|nr:23S rRNA (adenine(2030)-N(6))-methyltransferase RlmJ [bacterium]